MIDLKYFYNHLNIRKDFKNYLITNHLYRKAFTNIIKYIVNHESEFIEICWKWNGVHSKGGYPRYRGYNAHRYIWEITRNRSAKGFVIRHTCDNPNCVNPFHLRKGTKKDNANDMVSRGRSLKGEKHLEAKLSNKSVVYIIDCFLKQIYSIQDLAEIFNVSEPTITRIINGDGWKNINSISESDFPKIEKIKKENQKRNKISENDVINIRRLYQKGHKKSELSRMYNLGPTTIANIINYKSWDYLP